MKNGFETALIGLAAFGALMGAAFSQDALFRAHAWVLFFMLVLTTIVMMRRMQTVSADGLVEDDTTGYMDGVVRYGVIATIFWGLAGFLVGVVIATQLAWPQFNIEPWFNFGRLRPLHTSAVIFAFGGNALMSTSFYIVQRTSGARLFGGNLAWFVFWGYQLFIVLAATGYLLGITQSKEYAEPEWYVDLWLTLVWVSYLVVFAGTPGQEKRAAHLCGQLVLPILYNHRCHVASGQQCGSAVSFLGVKSYSLFSGVQDALTQWWYGHNAVGFFLTAGFWA